LIGGRFPIEWVGVSKNKSQNGTRHGYRVVVKKLKKITIMLFILGIFVEAFSFSFAYPNRFPFVLSIGSPKYVKASRGIKSLERHQDLLPRTMGFETLSQIVLERLAEENPIEFLRKIEINKISLAGESSQILSATGGGRNIIHLNIYLSNGQILKWDLIKLREKTETLKENDLFKLTFIVFGLGVFIQLIGLFFEIRPSRR